MAVSIRDVANHAGVSIATVSRVLNNTDYPVSDAVRHQVLKSAQELEYVPNHSARNLRKREGNGLALIVRNIGDPYYLPIVRGVTETALKYDSLAMVFNSMQDTLLEKRFYQRLQEWQLSGVLIGGGGYRTSEHDSVRRMICALQSMGLKTIALAPQDMKMPMVAIDNFNAGREITYYLIRHNHRRIAFIGGYVNHISDEERLMGYRVVLESMGRLDDLCDQLVEYPNFLRPHRSFLINMEYIANIAARSITMQDGAVVPLPHGKYSETKERYLSYIFDRKQVVM